MITDEGIDCKQYHESWTGITWNECELRRWLNTEFVSVCFANEELRQILSTKLSNNTGDDTEETSEEE